MEQKQRLAVFCALITFFLLIFGCAKAKTYRVYEGEDLPAGQKTTLAVPIYIDVITLDGKKMSMVSTFFRTGELNLELAPGRHAVVVRYNDIWNVTDEYHEKVQSEPAQLNFTAEPGRSYRVGLDEPKDLVSAQLYASDFRPWIEDTATGARLDASAEEPAETAAKAEVNETARPADKPAPPEPAGVPVVESPASPVSEEPAGVIHQEKEVSALEMLRFWWTRAGTDGKKSFMEWIVVPPAPEENDAEIRLEEEKEVSALDMLKFWWKKAGTQERKGFMEGLVDR